VSWYYFARVHYYLSDLTNNSASGVGGGCSKFGVSWRATDSHLAVTSTKPNIFTEIHPPKLRRMSPYHRYLTVYSILLCTVDELAAQSLTVCIDYVSAWEDYDCRV
jgi:hypothetical protein